jgi:hypothetical protein
MMEREARRNAMIAKRHKAVLELFNCSDGEARERFEQVLERNGLTADELETGYEEVCSSGNDVEGAAIAIAALMLTHPGQDSNEYLEAESRALNQTCLLLRLQGESDFPSESDLEFKVEEMLNIIHDGAERLAAGFQLTI